MHSFLPLIAGCFAATAVFAVGFWWVRRRDPKPSRRDGKNIPGRGFVWH